MKKLSRILALLLALLLALTCFAEEAAEEITEEPEERVILMTVGGMPVYQDDVEYYSAMLYYYGYTEDYVLVDGVNLVLTNKIAPALLTEGKIEELLGTENVTMLTEECKLAFHADVEEYAAAIAGEDATDDAKEAALIEAEATYAAEGITEESYVNEQIALAAFEILMDGVGCVPTDEEVQAYYDDYAESVRTTIGDNAYLYELYTTYYGYELPYRPEGYRGILHILLGADQELLDTYVNAGDDAAKAEAAAAIIAFNQETIDTIYADLDAGASFEEEISKYNTDPGMADPTTLAEGYAVHKNSFLWADEFTKGAFTEEMQQPGDWGNPVVSQFGVHILYYLCDLPSGIFPMTEDTELEIRDMLTSSKEQDYIVSALKQFEIVYFDAYKTVVGEENLLDW